MKPLVLIAIALLAACQPAEREQVPAPTTPSPSVPAGAIPASIVGEYRLAGIDGADSNSSTGIAVSISDGAISYEPRCLGYVWTYMLDNGAIQLERDPRYGPQKMADGSVTSCMPAVTPEYGRLAKALSVAEQVRRTPVNAIEFSGGGHSVTLFSQ